MHTNEFIVFEGALSSFGGYSGDGENSFSGGLGTKMVGKDFGSMKSFLKMASKSTMLAVRINTASIFSRVIRLLDVLRLAVSLVPCILRNVDALDVMISGVRNRNDIRGNSNKK